MHQLLAVGELPAEVVAVAWAQSCDGILVSDAGDCRGAAIFTCNQQTAALIQALSGPASLCRGAPHVQFAMAQVAAS